MLKLLGSILRLARGRSKIAISDDRVWLTKQGKLRGVCEELRRLRDTDLATVVVAHFPRTLDDLEKVLQEASIPFETSKTSLGPFDLFSAPPSNEHPVVLALSNLLSGTGSELALRDGQPTVVILVVESYPVTSRGRQILAFAEALPAQVRVSVHTSLDEPVFHHFGGERIGALMRTMGLREDAGIAHPAITAAIRRAQHRLEKTAIGDALVDSPGDWFRYNTRP